MCLVQPSNSPCHDTYPLAFFTIADILNPLCGIALVAPARSPLTPEKENTSAIIILGYFTDVIGILGSTPALTTGFAELYAMINARRLYINNDEEKKTLDLTLKTTIIHAGINGVVVFAVMYNLLMERHCPHENYGPYPHQIVLSGGTLLMPFYAAYLGGSLICKHGMGVQHMGDGVEEEKKELKKCCNPFCPATREMQSTDKKRVDRAE
ncbi:hypothetical protein B0O99DRAFT_746759 [Bisporella sp. PMI_857]|nr:hypothetical protein B0O99DRAFT_746759 [Bisporella sp. PMI_857]